MKKAGRKKNLLLLSMVAPGAIWLLLLRYLPIPGLIIAFQNYKLGQKSLVQNILHSPFVGLDNFKFMFTTSDTWVFVRNTIGYNVIFILLGLVLSVTFAIMLNEITSKFAAKSYQTMMFFPYFMSWVVASYFLNAFLDPTRGLIPELQKSMGWAVTDFYNDCKPWPFLLILCNVWKQTGYSTILYLAAITGIDASQYEAAEIDGATKWQQIKYVTIPHLKTMIIILFIMNVGKIFNSDFGLFFTVPNQSGALIPVTQTIDTYVYRGMMSMSYGMTTAAGFVQNLVGFICIMVANTIVRKVEPDSALF
ncbi:MAG: sugar ABC transporter permease [Lachnospiraceae bacterium]|nr:sugar ABC transporter permease [Lachnospiraceae bacterium]